MPEKIEQHIGTILQVMVIALLGWSLSTTVNLRTDVATLQAQMVALQSSVNQGTHDRYGSTEAARDFSIVWTELNRIGARLDKIEARR